MNYIHWTRVPGPFCQACPASLTQHTTATANLLESPHAKVKSRNYPKVHVDFKGPVWLLHARHPPVEGHVQMAKISF